MSAESIARQAHKLANLPHPWNVDLECIHRAVLFAEWYENANPAAEAHLVPLEDGGVQVDARHDGFEMEFCIERRRA